MAARPNGKNAEGTNADEPENKRPSLWDLVGTFLARVFQRRKEPAVDNTWIWLEGDQQVLRNRVRDFGGDSLRTVYGFMKGIALTTATVVIMRLFFQAKWDMDQPVHWSFVLLFLAWGVSFGVLLITYEAPMFASVLLMGMPPWWVTIFPSIFTIFEFLAFAILAPSFFLDAFKPESDFAAAIFARWCLINGIYHLFIHFFCLLAVFYFKKRSQQLHTWNSKIASTMDTFRAFLKWEVAGTIGVAILSFTMGMVLWNNKAGDVPATRVIWVVALMTVMFLFVGWSLATQYIKHHHTVREFERVWAGGEEKCAE